MKFYLTLIAVALSLVASAIPIPGTDVWYSQFVAVALFCLLLIGINIGEMSLALGALFIYCVISTIFIAHQDTMALVCLFQTAACLLMARGISNFDADKRKKVWHVIGGLLTLQITWGFIQHFNLDPLFRLTTNNSICDTVGFSGSHNQYGLFLAAASPVAAFFPVIIPFLFIALILSKTFTASVGFVCAWAFLLRKKFNVVLLLVTAVLIALLASSLLGRDLGAKYKERFFVWKLTASQLFHGKAVMDLDNNVKRIVTCNPLLGFGFERFYVISPYTQKAAQNPAPVNVFEHAHNDYIEALFDLGIIGFILVLGVFLELVILYIFPFMTMSLVRPLGLEMAMAGLIAFSVCALSIYTVHTAYNAFFLCVLLGLFYGEVKDGKKGRK